MHVEKGWSYSKVWVEIGGTASGNRITAEVDHFTKFAVFAVAKKEPEENRCRLYVQRRNRPLGGSGSIGNG
ncbi:hypothetical protein [Bacillus sp. FJAT-26390]|uniref:hypothetical protein n=1 Tax=Bacillus sp. FJAT-26390 TaxID=1743142 RepID=UPI000807A7D4|nr:hypothetical protein [Bacillus sp. FJAT-26390]OBZ09163.1 hypothetical protein A7975_23925 [Bacillus sp. FJAT-26390]